MSHPILGATEPDPIGTILGTGYFRFQSPDGIDGLAKWDSERLDLLAVLAVEPGQGYFRAFIRAAQAHFRTVYVWEIINPTMNRILAHYGFQRASEIDPLDGATLHGWKWEREAA